MAPRILVLIGLVALAAARCNRSSPTEPSATDHVPVVTGDGWSVSTPEAQGLARAPLDDAYRSAARLGHIYSLVVVKNGLLIGEQYFNEGGNVASRTASVTKSILSALVGILLRDGVLTSLDQRMMESFPEIDWQSVDPRKREITVGQLLQMRSGFPWEERSGDLMTVLTAPNKIPLIQQIPLAADPGTQFGYSNLGAHLLGIVVSRASGQSLISLAQSAIFDPLQARVASWPVDSLGYNTGGGDAGVSARDLAKFGQLYLNRGTYGGVQILPSAWILASRQPYSFNTYGTPILSDVPQLDYGYMWWSGTAGAHRVDFAWGHGGQIVAIVDDLNMVVVATSRFQSGFGESVWVMERAVLNLVFHLIASV